jgi:GxxExxY protein
MEILYPKLGYLLQGGLYFVQNEVGIGRPEEAYHQAFRIWLEENDIPYASKKPHPLTYRGQVAHTLYPDFVIDKKITVELKAKPRYLQSGDWVQIMNYLKCRKDKLGLLVNMGLDRVHIQRILREKSVSRQNFDWRAWENKPDPVLKTIRLLIETLFNEHQTGYGREVVDAILYFALSKEEIGFKTSPTVETSYKEISFGKTMIDCIILEQKVVFCHTALFDDLSFARSRATAFRKDLDLPYGIAVNFGKETFTVQTFS